MPPEFGSPAEFLAGALAFLRRRLSTILKTWLLAFAVALLYLVVAVPTFTSTAQLIVDAKTTSSDAASVTTAVDSQIAILKSDGVARAVIAKLGLARDPEFSAGALHRLSQSASRLLGWSRPETDPSLTRDALEAFHRKLSVRRAGVTYIVDLAFNSASPDRASKILSTVVESYIASQMDAKYKWGLQNEQWVKDRLSDLSGQAAAAKRAIADYNSARNNNPVSAGTAEPNGSVPDELHQLQATADAAAKAYDNFLRMLRYTDAVQQQAPPVFEARLLTGVSEPYTASSPNARLVLAVSILGGLLLGIGIGLLRDWSAGRFPVARRSAGGAYGVAAVVQAFKASSAKAHLDGPFRAEKHPAYKDANPDF
ncbi:Wzz/FepE/Etk N-terminal domain-containing protein [Bradyrhizobium sp. USDA 3364]